MQRSAHLVGSIPCDSAAEAMDLALDLLGRHLRTLPDGETGERRNWIVHIIESMRDHPDLELRRDGDYSNYDRTPVFKVRPGHTLSGKSLDFGHVAAFEQSFPLFEKRRAEHGRPDLAFQVGIPGDFDMAVFVLGATGPFRHRRPFTEATVREIHAIHDRARDQVMFQIEVPAELVFVARMPSPLQRLMAAYLGRGVANLAARAPIGTRFGVHLCLGDMNHRALGRMRDTAPLVHLANAVARNWPAGRALEYLHAPFAAAAEPAPTDPAFYKPLVDLELPAATRFVAGFVHEARTLSQQQELLRLIERRVGRAVDVATACGLGRRERAAAEATMRQAAALCAT